MVAFRQRVADGSMYNSAVVLGHDGKL
eukprot:COSAG03_NODE_17181_length_381_cov_316.248227_1_plen_26_part_10